MPQRYGRMIRLRPEKYDEYKRLHEAVWPEVLQTVRRCHIRNYSIFHAHGYLFAYLEYHGTDFEADMAKMALDPKTREWWELTDPCQVPVEGNSSGSLEGNWWTEMEELFHLD
jgi:L-rhamnose mutarotase